MMRVWQKIAISAIALIVTSTTATAQTENDISADLGQKAVHAVIAKSVLDNAVLVSKTGKALSTTGNWSVGRTRSEACPQTPDPCVTVFYLVPDAGVACEWTVLLPGDASSGQLLAENEDAAQYFVLRLAPTEAAAFVQSRAVATDPPIARAAHMTGDVILRVVVGPDGVPMQVVALSGPEMLKGAAIDAGKRWRFKPCTVGGRAVRYQMELTFMFRAVGTSDSPAVAMKP
jgi:TonB family protein